jgi:hypothetical protein
MLLFNVGNDDRNEALKCKKILRLEAKFLELVANRQGVGYLASV